MSMANFSNSLVTSHLENIFLNVQEFQYLSSIIDQSLD